MKKQYSLLIHSAFFDILLQQKVRQVGLSETRKRLRLQISALYNLMETKKRNPDGMNIGFPLGEKMYEKGSSKQFVRICRCR